MDESLRSLALKRFKNNLSSYISVGILCALFLVLVSLLSFIDVAIFILGIAVLGLPFLFASHVSCYFLEAGQQITISSFFRYFVGFFNPQFRSSFRGIISFFKSLAVYVISMVVVYIVFLIVFTNYYGADFTNAMTELVKQYIMGISYEQMMELLNDNGAVLLTFITYVSAFPLPIALAFFIYASSFNSLSIYYRLNMTMAAPPLLRLAVANAYSRYRRSMRKDWFKINWPILVLPIVGAAIGGVLVFTVFKNVLFLAPLLIIGAVLSLIFFLPFYFSNMEVLYHRYENAFKEGNKMAIETILNRIQTSIDLSEEEKRSLEASFKDEEDKKE